MVRADHSPPEARAPLDTDPGLDPVAILRDLWARKWMVIGVTLLVGAGATVYASRQPKVYATAASVEFDPSPARPLGHEVEDVADPIGSYWTTRESFATQQRIMHSRALAIRVVEKLGLQHDAAFMGVPPEQRDAFRGATAVAAATMVQRNLRIEAVEGTRLVRVVVEDLDPERAAAIANAVAETYIEKTLEDRMSSTVTALEWLGEQLENLRSDLDESELALHQFKLEHNILSVSMEDRRNLIARDIEAFSEALTAARIRRIELEARAERLHEANRDDPLEVADTALEGHQALEGLRSALRAKIAERDALAVRYGEAHPRMREVESSVQSLRSQLQSEVRSVIEGAEANLAEARRVEAGLSTALDRAHDAGLELNLRGIEYERLNRQRENQSKLYELVLERTTETDLTRMLRTTHVRVVDEAIVPRTAIRPNVPKATSIGVAVGLFLGLGLALLASRLDRRVETVEDVEALGLTVLGVMPTMSFGTTARARRRLWPRRRGDAEERTPSRERDLVVHTHPMSQVSECARTIRTNLTFMAVDEPLRALLVTSTHPRDGKTTVALNVATAMAQSGKRVLLVDTDLRRPRIHDVFEAATDRGVSSVLVGESSLEAAIQKTEIPDLDVLTSGPVPPNPSELLHSSRLAELLDQGLRVYDRVIFDSPPIGAVTDAAVLANQVDGTLLVVKAGHTTRDAIQAALRQLAGVGIRPAGVVLNDVDVSRGSYGYYAGSYRYEGAAESWYGSKGGPGPHGDDGKAAAE